MKSVEGNVETQSGTVGAASPEKNHQQQGLATQATGTDGVSAGNVDKIREIIFGGQMRDYDKRFTRLEERLLKESVDLRDDTKRRIEQLENYVRNEFDALSDQLKKEQNERNKVVSDLTNELRDLVKTYERKVGELDDPITKSGRDLRQQLADQSRNLSDEMRQKDDVLSATLQREAAELRADKTDRAALAALFSEVALRLNDEFSLPSE